MKKGLEQQRLAVQSGYWPLIRYNPVLAGEGKNPLTLDSKAPSIALQDYAYNETRFRMLLQSDETRAEMLMKLAQADVRKRWAMYQYLANMPGSNGGPAAEGGPGSPARREGTQGAGETTNA